MNRKIKKAILVIAFTASTIILLLILYKVRIVKKCEITNRIDFGGEQFNYMQNGMPFSVYADENSIYFFSKDKECFIKSKNTKQQNCWILSNRQNQLIIIQKRHVFLLITN